MPRKPTDHADKMTRWAGGALAKAHALGPRVAEIANHQARNEITSLSIRGREGTGKTTLARVLAHMLHVELDKRAHSTDECSPHERKHRQAMKRGYVVKIFDADDLKNLTLTMEAMPSGMNRICIFDDSSFMGASASRVVQKIKHELTKIRHTSAGDVKAILIFNFHYSKALDPYLRDTHFIFHTSISGPEMGNMRELYSDDTGRNMRVLGSFQASTQAMNSKGQCTITFGKITRWDSPFKITYKYSDPFRLTAVFDGTILRQAVYPAAGGPNDEPDPLGIAECGTCAAAAAAVDQTEAGPRIDPVEAVEWLKKQWAKPDMIGAALRAVYVRRHGRDPIHRDKNTAMEMIARLEATGACSYEHLVAAYFRDDPAAAERILGGPGRRPSVPAPKRAAFLHTFNFDGLRRPSEKAIKAPSEKDVEAVQEAMR